MTIVWSLPVRGERLDSSRGDVVRARHLIDALHSGGHDVVVVDDARHGHTRLAAEAYRTWLRSRLPRRAAFIVRDLGRCMHGCLHGAHVAAAVRATHANLIVETQVAYTVSGALASRMTGVPLLLDDCSPSCEELEFGDGLSRVARATLALQAKAARRVVAVSSVVAEMLAADGVPREKLVCVPNGVSVDAFARVAPEPPREPTGPETTCVVGFVGSFQPWHRVDLLVDAVAALPLGCSIHVVLVGAGPGLADVLAAADTRGVRDRVTALGAVPAADVPTLLSAWDIGVLPHSNEYGDPMKLREYAAAGLPAVAPDLAPVREVVESEVTGLLFPPGDVRALTRALARLAADSGLARRLGQQGRRRVIEHDSWTQRARVLLEAASGVHGSRRRPAQTSSV